MQTKHILTRQIVGEMTYWPCLATHAALSFAGMILPSTVCWLQKLDTRFSRNLPANYN